MPLPKKYGSRPAPVTATANDGKTQQRNTLRYRSPVDARGYTMLLNTVLYDAVLSDGAKVTYMVLLDYARQDEACYPGQDSMAASRGLTPRSVRTHLTELEDRGLITVEQRGLNQTNMYWIESVQEVYKALIAEGKIANLRPDRKKTSTPDRQKTSGPDRQKIADPERKKIAGQDRQKTSDYKDAGLPQRSQNKTAATTEDGEDRDNADIAAAALSDLIIDLVAAGLNKSDAIRLEESHPDEAKKQLAYLPFVEEIKSSPGAWLRSAIEQGFAPPKGWKLAQHKAEKRAQADRERDGTAAAALGVASAADQLTAQVETERTRIEAEEPERWSQLVACAEKKIPQGMLRKKGESYERTLAQLIRSLIAEQFAEEAAEEMSA